MNAAGIDATPEAPSPDIPAPLRERVFLYGGVIHISEELRGDLVLDSFLSLAARQGIGRRRWLPAEEFDVARTTLGPEQPPAANPVQEQAVHMLAHAFALGASDIHIAYHATFGTIRLRRMGMLESEPRMLGGEAAITLIRAIYQSMTSAGAPQFVPSERQEGRIVDRAFLPPTVHAVRVHTEPLECAGGPGTLMTLRLLYDATTADGPLARRLEVLGYPEREREGLALLIRRTGLTLVAGPTGHGKSTLLKHVMESRAMENPEQAFLSIEDPPEYPLRRVHQILVGSDDELRGRAYQKAIAGAMRSDPDVIMVGEVRYPEAAVAAVDAALTGHTVWTSIHAGSAFGILRRMFSLLTAARFADPLEYLCDPHILAGLVYQRLLPVLCPHCKIPLARASAPPETRPESETGPASTTPAFLPAPLLRRLRRTGVALDGVHLRGPGCSHCMGLGVIGQTVAPEVVVTNARLLRLVHRRNLPEAEAYWRRELGGVSAMEQALALIAGGMVDPGQAEARLGSPLQRAPEYGPPDPTSPPAPECPRYTADGFPDTASVPAPDAEVSHASAP